MLDGSRVGGLGEKGEGIKKFNLAVTKQSRGRKCSIGNTASSIVRTMHGARWALDLSGGSFSKLYKCLITVFCT